MSESHAAPSPSTPLFWTVAAVIGALLTGAFVKLALDQGFAFDDFLWLDRVQRGSFSLFDTFFPIERRSWWGYRPLSNETFFLVGLRSFGFDPTAFNFVSLSFHLATAALLSLLARQLGCGLQTAAIAGLLYASRPPAIHSALWSSSFIYVGCLAFMMATLVAFTAHAKAPSALRVTAAGVALLLALLCHEVALALPPVLGLISLFVDRDALRDPSTRTAAFVRCVVRTLPLLALWSGFAVFRFFLIADSPMTGGYGEPDDASVPAAAWRHLSHLFNGSGQIALPLAVGLGAVVSATARPGRAFAVAWWLPMLALSFVWAIVMLVPFLPLSITGARYALPVSLPASLAIAACLQMITLAVSTRGPRTAELLLCLALVASIPYDVFQVRFAHPQGALAAAALDRLALDEPHFHPGTRVVVLYGGESLAHSSREFTAQSVGGSLMLKSRFPLRGLRMGFQHVEEPVLAVQLGPHTRYYELRRDGDFEPAKTARLEALFERALSSEDPEVSALGAHQLARLLGRPARPRIESAAAHRQGADAARVREALWLLAADGGGKRGAQLRKVWLGD